MTILSLELRSDTLPQGKTIIFNLRDEGAIAALKSTPVTIKEGVEYSSVYVRKLRIDIMSYHILYNSVGATFQVEHGIVTGLRYIQVVKKAGLKGV